MIFILKYKDKLSLMKLDGRVKDPETLRRHIPFAKEIHYAECAYLDLQTEVDMIAFYRALEELGGEKL